MNTTQKIEEGSQQLSDDFSTSLLRNDTLEIRQYCASTQIQGSLCLLLSR